MEEVDDLHDDDYFYFDKATLFYFIFILISAFLTTAFYQIDIINEFVLSNREYIQSNLDLEILYWIVIIIPYYSIWIIIVIRIIKAFWRSYEFVKIRILIRKFRINFSIFGYLALIIFTFFNQAFFTFYTIGIPLIILFLLNIFFIDYSEVEELETKYSRENPNSRKIKNTEITYFQIISLIILGFCSIFYFGNIELFNLINSFFDRLNSDIAMCIVFWTTLACSIFWFACSFLIDAIITLFNLIKENLLSFFKILFILLLFYFLAKIIMFNLSNYLDEPYPTFISMGVSIVGILFQRNSTKIMTWFKNRRKGEDE